MRALVFVQLVSRIVVYLGEGGKEWLRWIGRMVPSCSNYRNVFCVMHMYGKLWCCGTTDAVGGGGNVKDSRVQESVVVKIAVVVLVGGLCTDFAILGFHFPRQVV